MTALDGGFSLSIPGFRSALHCAVPLCVMDSMADGIEGHVAGDSTESDGTIGYWSEVKLEIVREYASAYSKILATQKRPEFHHVYVDAFAGSGIHRSRRDGRFVAGSPLNALRIQPPFREFHLIDLDSQKAAALRRRFGSRPDVHIHEGDCNDILLRDIFPRLKREDYRRGLCLLDPYGMHLSWDVIKAAADLKSTEIFLNFPIGDMNRNAMRRDASTVEDSQAERMTRYWGDDSWRRTAYSGVGDLFGHESKVDNDAVTNAFCERLKSVAGFSEVSRPMPMRNSRGATIYYLIFAAHKSAATKIVRDIFKKFSGRGAA